MLHADKCSHALTPPSGTTVEKAAAELAAQQQVVNRLHHGNRIEEIRAGAS